MALLKQIIGYNTEEKAFDTFGREYLKKANNPGAMLFHGQILVVRDDNKTFTREENIELVELLIKIEERNATVESED